MRGRRLPLVRHLLRSVLRGVSHRLIERQRWLADILHCVGMILQVGGLGYTCLAVGNETDLLLMQLEVGAPIVIRHTVGLASESVIIRIVVCIGFGGSSCLTSGY